MKQLRIRINNIEYRPFDKDNKNYYGEFVCYYPNEYYGHEADYKQDPNDPDYYFKYDTSTHIRIHKSCFVHPESCYVAAMLTRAEEPDIRSVGDRPWNLNEADEKDFKTVVKMVFERVYQSEEEC